ncbi:MAG TPA: aminotransferase class III-fold pyridoxal phosphate-dependent enzyme, partial [Planctomycetes bacterium]|nr:aminotransferase class III-fold pyridoxal phosphate-dependent enzyme [Planctomycetota bacterium]
VGFGTCQLRLVPEEQAVQALAAGFERGVNWVHVSPDYCADEIVAEAMRRTARRVIPVADGSGDMDHFEACFERACNLHGPGPLPLWGISCIDDQEFVGRNVWGAKGMVEFINARKRDGSLLASYTTTHAPPDAVARLIESGAFDAIMLAWNPLGFHVLSSYAAAEGKKYEDMRRCRELVFPLAAERKVSLLVMKALGGGLLGESHAFPPHDLLAPERKELQATDILRHVLAQEGVTAVVPGTACLAEATENALAGHAPLELPTERERIVVNTVDRMRTTLCSRCGECESTCSRGLPISWLFREAYIWLNPADTFDAVSRLHYDHLHPEPELACVTCDDQSCLCDQGLDIPLQLGRAHQAVQELKSIGGFPEPPLKLEGSTLGNDPAVLVIQKEWPSRIHQQERIAVRFWLENSGLDPWLPVGNIEDRTRLEVHQGAKRLTQVRLREEVHTGVRCHFAFEIVGPDPAAGDNLRVLLYRGTHGPTELSRCQIIIGPPTSLTVNGPSAVETRRALDVCFENHNIPSELDPGQVLSVQLLVRNTGTDPWHKTAPAGDHVGLAVHWDAEVVANHPLPIQTVVPGAQIRMCFALETPVEPGPHRLQLEFVRYQVTVFSDQGAPNLDLTVNVPDQPISRTARLWSGLQRTDPWHYLPTRGISRLADGTAVPVFIERSEGCHQWDTEGRKYIDYTMGWGSVLLGYAYPTVTKALTEAVNKGHTLAWPQPVEIEVAEMLVADFPGAEMACFAKNGSDACTFAARMARVFTGKKTILFSGYHGWQDFWVEQVGFERTGVPTREPALIHRFPFHDLTAFQTLLDEHKDDLAAVFLEPSPWAGNGFGFEPDSDPLFLRTVARKTKEAGALLVFDEIVTGYRYPEHSAAAAKGITPDLTCLGKAIASGLPLSAVVGRADVFKQALPHTFYAATFHAECLSLAAAKAAIETYHREPVAKHIWSMGQAMLDGLRGVIEQSGVKAEMWGTPFRMNLRFCREDPDELLKERTLMQQELLRAGISTYNGVMLPCYVHDEHTLAKTLDGFGRAFEVVERAGRTGDFDRLLEIPLLVDL